MTSSKSWWAPLQRIWKLEPRIEHGLVLHNHNIKKIIQKGTANFLELLNYRPWCSGYKICFVCAATVLSLIRFVSVSPTSSQYDGVYPDNCNTYQYRKPFKNGEISQWFNMLQILQLGTAAIRFRDQGKVSKAALDNTLADLLAIGQ